jgi:NAD(P)-dependent dehydrogenase (short-subunit alcohol dehydrogenase family)
LNLLQLKSDMVRNQKIAVVTGAGTGIGRAVSLALQHDDWFVVLAGRREKALQETANLGLGGKSMQLATDVTDAESVIHLFNETVNHLGRIDLLFNNAGIGAPSKSFDELSLEDWQQVIATNLTGSFLCAREAFRVMKIQHPGGGRIINNGSVSAHLPRPNSAPYTASKHGITGLTRSIALDGREFNICCGQIDFGNAATEMASKMVDGILQPDGSIRPEPTMTLDNAARAVLYMASLPLDTNVPFMTVMANKMPYMGRG